MNRYTKRRRLGGAAIATIAVVALAACAPVQSSESGVDADAADPVRGGTLVVGDPSNNWTTLDPLITNTNVGPYKAMYDALFRFEATDGAEAEIQPMLAVDWNLDDPLHPQIDLREDVTFHDGSEFTAEVAAWNIDRMVNLDGSNAASTLSDILDVSVVDEDTIELTLAQESASIFVRLSESAGVGRSIVSMQAVESNGEQWLGANAAGTGPFELEEFVQDQHTSVVANENYWAEGADGEALPYLDGIDYQILRDTGAAMSGLKAGSVDVVADPSNSMLTDANSSELIDVVEMESWNGYPGTFGFNYKRAPFDSAEARQAAQYALDRETIANVINPDFSEPAQVPIWSDAFPGWRDDLDSMYDFDLDTAKQLASDAGIAEGTKATLIYQSREPDATIAQLWKEMWAEIGIDLTTEPLEETVFESRLVAGDFDVATWGWGTPLAPDFANVFWQEGGAQNWVDYDDPELSSLLDEASTTIDEASQDELYADALSLLMEEAVYGVIVRQTPTVLKRSDVGGTHEIWGSLDVTRAYKVD